MTLVAWLAFSWALVAQHGAYASNAFDLAFFDQIIWNTSQGRWFETTFVPYNFLGQHVEPVLLLYAAIYRLTPRVEVLLLSQAAVAAVAAVPLFVAARRLLASEWAAVAVAGAYLIAPHLHDAVLFDFHPEVMGTAAVFGALALLAHGRPGRALAAFATLFFLKEEAAVTAVGFALIVWRFGYRRHATGLATAGGVYLALVVGLFMPAVRGGPSDLTARYGYILTSGGQTDIAGAPARTLAHLTAPNQRDGLRGCLRPRRLAPLLSPAALAAAPVTLGHLLPDHLPQGGLRLHYAVLPFAMLTAATVVGLATVRRPGARWGNRAMPAGVLLLVVTQTAGCLLFSPLGLSLDPARYHRTAHTDALDRVVRSIPPQASVSAQSGVAPHLSQRREVWEFPTVNGAEYVVVVPGGWSSSQAQAAGYRDTLATLPARGYCLQRDDDGVLVYRRKQSCGSP
ncbi:MAG: DUF2079 domain-containing protein [Dehalococcoidia bacterium]